MKETVRLGEKQLKKIEDHLYQIGMIEEYQERNIPYHYCLMNKQYYYILRVSIFLIKIIFNEYGISMDIPILRCIDEEEIDNCDCWAYEDLLPFSFQVFCQFGWHLEEVSCVKDINAREIEKCIKKLPDSKDEYFLKLGDIVEEFKKDSNVLDYFAILYFPGLANLENWLRDHKKNNERLLKLYECCAERLKYVFCEGYSDYPSISLNGTWYIPIIIGYNEVDSSDDVSMANFMPGKIFDAFVFSVLYKTAKKRGYEDGYKQMV